MPATAYEVLLEEIRRALNDVGAVNTLGRSFAWHSTNAQRPVHVTVAPRNGQTRIRVEERLGNLAGGLFGGIMGGLGGGVMGVAMGVGIGVLNAPAAAALLAVGLVSASYGLARGIFSTVAGQRATTLRTLTDALAEDVTLVGFLVPKLGAAVLIAVFVHALLPPSFFAKYMRHETGLRGMAIASATGTVTPGGPMTSFPLVTVLRDSGSGIGALVTYVTAWSTTGLQRVFMWEVPLMGPEFATIRFLASVPLGIVAGILLLVFLGNVLPFLEEFARALRHRARTAG